MRKTYQYRILPTKAQTSALNKVLEECRWLYNFFLEQRQTTYKTTGKSLNQYDQNGQLPILKEQRPSLKIVYSQVLQNVALRVDLAYQAFFRRIKSGDKPGYPRFKSFGRYNSFTFPQVPVGCSLVKNIFTVSKIGDIKICRHRKLRGIPKTCTIKQSSTGKWYASFNCEMSERPIKSQPVEKVGIDVGLSTFATFDTGETIKRERFFKTDEKALAKAQRRLAKEIKGSSERVKRRIVVAKIYERIKNRRHDFAHQHSRRIVDRFGFIAVEDLNVNRMKTDGKFGKSINDVAWSTFFNCLSYKAAEAGRTFVKVNPAYTSQTCSSCGFRQTMSISERTYSCPQCSLVLDRDHNAAINILKLGLGLQTVGIQSVEVPAAR